MSVAGDEVRKRRSRTEWHSLLARYSRSELTVAGFCQAEGICPASFYRWQALLGKDQESRVVSLPGASPGFVDLGPLDLSPRTTNPHLEIKLDLGGGLVLHLVRR
jgi:putative transposase